MSNIEKLFPGLTADNYQITSPQTGKYNCIAWAAGDDSRWWEPAPMGAGYYWPVANEQFTTLAAAIQAFQSEGFELAASDGLEAGLDKIAIYGHGGEYTHAARQLLSGQWTSKLGSLEDIAHDAPEDLCGVEYGIVEVIMKRAQTSPN